MAIQVIEKLEEIKDCLSHCQQPDVKKTILKNVWWLRTHFEKELSHQKINRETLNDLIQTLIAILNHSYLILTDDEFREFNIFLKRLQDYQQSLDEKLVRQKYCISEIISLMDKPAPLLAEIRELPHDESVLRAILDRATHIYGLAGIEEAQGRGEAFTIKIALSKSQHGKTGEIRLSGRYPQIEEITEKAENGQVITKWKSRIESAVGMGVKAAFSYVNGFLRETHHLPKSVALLRIQDYDIDCFLGTYARLDGESIGLAVAIATISELADLPTRERIAFTGRIDVREVTTIGEVGLLPQKLQAAVDEGISCIVIPQDSYMVLKRSSELKSFSNRINIKPVSYLTEAIDIAFDKLKITRSLKEKFEADQREKDILETRGRLDQERSQESQHRLEVQRPVIVGMPFIDTTSFKNREDKRAELRRCLEDPTRKLICIVGSAGIGKTALLSKICVEIESGELRLSNSRTRAGINGILYIDCHGTNRPTVRRLFDRAEGVGKWLGSPHAEELEACWHDSSRTVEDKTYFLLNKVREGCYLLVLDNLDDLLTPDNTIADPALCTFVNLCLKTSHGLRLIATSRERVVVDRQVIEFVHTVNLNEGLPPDEAVTWLCELDRDGTLGLSHARDELYKAVGRCHGIPHALKSVYAILRSDSPPTLTQLLADDRLFNEQVVENLMAESHRRVSDDQRRALEALAIFEKPVPAEAVRRQLARFFPDIDVERCLRALERKYLVIYDREYATYKLHHPLNQQHAHACIPDKGGPYTKSACHRRAAEFYEACRKPSDEWRSFTDLQPQLDEIRHLTKAHEYDAACSLLADIDTYLMSWGYYQEVRQLRDDLKDKLSAHWQAANATALAECLYQGFDEWDKALELVQQVKDSAESHRNELALAEAVQLHAHILFERGKFDDALAMAHENLQRYERNGTRAQVANTYNSLGVFVDAVGSWEEAVGYYKQAETRFEDLGNAPEMGRVRINRSVAEFFLHGAEEALEVCRNGLALCPQQERPQEFAYGMLNRAVYHLAAGDWENAESALAECTLWAESEQWFLLTMKLNRSTLHRFREQYEKAKGLLQEVLGPFKALEDNWGEIDHSINRGCILSARGKNTEAMEAWEKSLVTAQEKSYFLGIRMSAYLLSKNNSGGTLSANVAEWSREFEQDFLPRFKDKNVFMPCYVLLLRAKPSIQ